MIADGLDLNNNYRMYSTEKIQRFINQAKSEMDELLKTYFNNRR